MTIAYSPTLVLNDSHVAIYKIYVLKNPFDNSIFYVGQTKMTLSQRLYGHLADKTINKAKQDCIRDILEKGGTPIIECIETIPSTCYKDKLMVNEREIYWIKFYKESGVNISNVAAVNYDLEYSDYKKYIASVKSGNVSLRYYYCGRTFSGHEVYDEQKLKIDGYIIQKKEQIEQKQEAKEDYIPPKPSIYTEIFMVQPSWSYEFSKDLANYYKSDDEYSWIDELMETDDCDYEDEVWESDADDESTGDDEMGGDHETGYWDNFLNFECMVSDKNLRVISAFQILKIAELMVNHTIQSMARGDESSDLWVMYQENKEIDGKMVTIQIPFEEHKD
jgi:hypothetical protein